MPSLRTLPAALLAMLMAAPSVMAEPVTIQLKNGDTIHGEQVPEESNDSITVVIHPQLGRLEISSDAIKPKEEPPAWSSTVSAGVIAVGEDGDDSMTLSMNASSTYRKDADKLVMKGGMNYKTSRDEGESFDVDTEKGSASIRYDRELNETVNFFTSGSYDYNGLNDVSINTLKGAFGAGFPVIKNETTELVLSVGPALQWSEGGRDCDGDEFCGNTYPGGTFTTQLNWIPNPSFKFHLDNNLSLLATDSEAKPTNSFTAMIKYFPSFNSGLFTSLKFESIYNSIAIPELSNTVSGQLGMEF